MNVFYHYYHGHHVIIYLKSIIYIYGTLFVFTLRFNLFYGGIKNLQCISLDYPFAFKYLIIF
jgi:hypothetical protein